MSAMVSAYGLVIGIANYQHINPLPATVLKDATDIRELLTDPHYCAYPPENVLLLLDENATQNAFRQAFASLAQRSHQESTLFIYLSSHGGRIEAGPCAGEYILPVDTRYASNEALAKTAISGTEFTNALRAIPARKVTVIFDCCHSGGVGQPKDATVPQLKALPESYYDALKAGQGRVILASSRSSEYSYVLPGASNSLFTTHLLAGLRGGIASDDGLIRIFDLFEYIQPLVTKDQSNQHPVFKAELEENFPVALYRAGQVGVVAKDAQGFRYDAYVSHAENEPDSTWVWKTLVPRLEGAGLRIAVSGDVDEPGVARVVNIERGVKQSKRTLIVLSEAYLRDNMADFENVLGQTLGIQEGAYRLLPIKISAIDQSRLPLRISMLAMLDFESPRRLERELERLIQSLQGPLPRR
ncbi:caspase family protein [Bradyrhizobium sp. 200]|uniref:caspase family protein n=1 Tax=Bradyrhizobium sp. 200 TaxID=2782665 RepID=UPI001FFF3D1C|nr:caspase family protein [Bradyrhizobium sp. 200]UPJ49342.1 caspase family protein [Bradyrhizobium sp. 200]